MHSLDRPRQTLAFALAALAGYVDAVGFLSADRYFVSFMSGNTTRLATEIVADAPKGLIPALLLTGFVLGVAAGSVVAHKAGAWRKPAVLALVTLLLGTGAALATGDRVSAMMALLVMAMGALNNTLQRGETPIALTYLTGALVRVGQGLAGLVTGRAQEGLGSFVALWLSLACGAAVGATLFDLLGAASLLVAVAWSAMLTVAGYRLAARARPRLDSGSV